MQNLVRSVGQPKGTESVNEVRDVEIVLKALADRVSKGVDIAERTDVTARQVRDTLRLRQQVRFLADWPIEFSRLKIAVISRHSSKYARRANVSGVHPTGGIRNLDL